MGPAWTQPPLRPLSRLGPHKQELERAKPKKKAKAKAKGAGSRKGRKTGAQAQTPLSSTAASASAHNYLKNGVVLANPAGRHPIYELIENAEREWEGMLHRQSKSLDEAVAEYERRYGRRPPKGFDRWWDYVETHDVLLPDEYDQIHEDLEPFWAIPPELLQDIQYAWEAAPDTYTLGRYGNWKGAGVTIVNDTLRDATFEKQIRGSREITALLKDVQEFIPPFRAVFSTADGPSLLSSWRLREEAKKTVQAGKYLDIADLPPHEDIGWLSACAPTSPARAVADAFALAPLNTTANRTRAFVHAPLRASDPCQHPSLLTSHSAFLAHGKGPALPDPRLVPQFSCATTGAHADVVAVGYQGTGSGDDEVPAVEWEEKLDGSRDDEGNGRLFWRGGPACAGEAWCGAAQRARLVKLRDGGGAVMVANATGWGTAEVEAGGGGLLDVRFADRPMDARELARHKFAMDVDGGGEQEAGFKRLLASGAVVLRSTVRRAWFERRMVSWVHYVPVQNDYSDVLDVMAFFTGLGGDAQVAEKDALAKRIAEHGKEWTRRMWRKEDLTAYLFRLFLEYARLMSVEREKMDFEDIENEWRR
ncbi:hypothetical protein PUNSTDRAFT_59402 [Punctularia strigosozonata HHB-11173 SS5]|uniref:uncharacterized protein n=1 Tax=Punctularia strigosozonata (strain HHB-11173) TaxID=741275 RepID=UPI00044171CF|nr:uncharacterized protein PUNSTDRAFT_59402 [Punctularia strigosozonata HHB-11173 SS5]EIN13346.1 hypothetical protein PUNSTDRAFT_59402 [Punctularia strigosozonata HHB-11173 SS5]